MSKHIAQTSLSGGERPKVPGIRDIVEEGLLSNSKQHLDTAKEIFNNTDRICRGAPFLSGSMRHPGLQSSDEAYLFVRRVVRYDERLIRAAEAASAFHGATGLTTQ